MHPALQLALACGLGAFLWSFLEYALHNWRGHLGRGRNRFSREHLRHHREGDYFTPLGLKVVMALPWVASFLALSIVAAGPVVGPAFTAGFTLAYIGYEVLHRREHTHAPRGWYGRWARRHHFHHHFVRPDRNHGVTSPLWDLVFRTYDRPGVIRVPERLAMEWLVDPRTGEVYEEHASDYALRRRRAPAPEDRAAALAAASAS